MLRLKVETVIENKLITSKQTSESRAAIPEKIRKTLGLHHTPASEHCFGLIRYLKE